MCYNRGMNVEDLIAVARELKMPLATLRQLALLMREADGDSGWLCDEMVGVSERAMRQVNDLLRLERLPSGLYEMEPVAVRAACDEAYGEVRRLCGGCEVRVQYRNRIPLVTANRELLGSIVYNMLASASEVAQDEIRMMVRDTRDGVEIDVRDRGPVLEAMRPNGLSLLLVASFSRYLHAETKVVRHRDGMSHCIWLPHSQQRRLW